jgi:hypothetical protein
MWIAPEMNRVLDDIEEDDEPNKTDDDPWF